MGCVGLESRRDAPAVGAGVFDTLGDGHDGDDVGRGAAEEDEGDIA